MLVTELGIVTEVRAVLLKKAPLPIEVTPCGITTGPEQEPLVTTPLEIVKVGAVFEARPVGQLYVPLVGTVAEAGEIPAEPIVTTNTTNSKNETAPRILFILLDIRHSPKSMTERADVPKRYVWSLPHRSELNVLPTQARVLPLVC